MSTCECKNQNIKNGPIKNQNNKNQNNTDSLFELLLKLVTSLTGQASAMCNVKSRILKQQFHYLGCDQIGQYFKRHIWSNICETNLCSGKLVLVIIMGSLAGWDTKLVPSSSRLGHPKSAFLRRLGHQLLPSSFRLVSFSLC